MFEQENQWYIEQLYNKQFVVARKYLKMRNILPSTAKFWGLGFSPITLKNPYALYDKLKGRITIPIYNQNGKLISISGRHIYNGYPKYDHYPFPSRSILFGLYQNRNDIRQADTIYITEGQMDVIKAWQVGVRNVVSTFGAHCSLSHISIASRNANNIVVIYDNDYAGQNGARTILQEFKKYTKIQAKCILPKGQDLDNYFNEHTKEDFELLINENETKRKLQRLKEQLF